MLGVLDSAQDDGRCAQDFLLLKKGCLRRCSRSLDRSWRRSPENGNHFADKSPDAGNMTASKTVAIAPKTFGLLIFCFKGHGSRCWFGEVFLRCSDDSLDKDVVKQ